MRMRMRVGGGDNESGCWYVREMGLEINDEHG